MSEAIPKPGANKIAPNEVKQEVKPIAVEAIDKGFIAGPNGDWSRKVVGDKFFILSEKQFSKNWMKKI
jgi:hypothetical protein